MPSDRKPPEWLETPDQTFGYFLCFQENSTFEQEIELSRAEYIGLKTHLATLRGYVVEASGDPAPATVRQPTKLVIMGEHQLDRVVMVRTADLSQGELCYVLDGQQDPPPAAA